MHVSNSSGAHYCRVFSDKSGIGINAEDFFLPKSWYQEQSRKKPARPYIFICYMAIAPGPKSKIQTPNGPFGFWCLEFGFRILDFGFLDFGFRILDFGSV